MGLIILFLAIQFALIFAFGCAFVFCALALCYALSFGSWAWSAFAGLVGLGLGFVGGVVLGLVVYFMGLEGNAGRGFTWHGRQLDDPEIAPLYLFWIAGGLFALAAALAVRKYRASTRMPFED